MLTELFCFDCYRNFDGEIYDPNKDGGEQSTARSSSNSFGSAEMLRPITKGARRNEQLQGLVTKVIKPFNSEQPQVNGMSLFLSLIYYHKDVGAHSKNG